MTFPPTLTLLSLIIVIASTNTPGGFHFNSHNYHMSSSLCTATYVELLLLHLQHYSIEFLDMRKKSHFLLKFWCNCHWKTKRFYQHNRDLPESK